MNAISSRLPAESGTYALHLRLDSPQQLTIGKRGDVEFPAGHYLYIGSAFGSGGLRGRLKHHLRPVRKPHWHIDYLRQTAPLRTIWYAISETVYEHTWANTLLSLTKHQIIAPGFRASDCNCTTHLIYFDTAPDFKRFQQQTDATLTHITLNEMTT